MKIKLAPPKPRRSIAVKFRTGAGAHQKPAKALRQQAKAALRREIKAGSAHNSQVTFHIGSAMPLRLFDMTSQPAFVYRFEQTSLCLSLQPSFRLSSQPCPPKNMRFTLM